MIPAAVQSGSGLFLALLGLYLVAGCATAGLLARRGHPPATSGSALLAWPLLVPLLGERPRPPGAGPFGARIDATFCALEETLGDPAAGEVPWSGDLEGLRVALHRGDQRIGLVDRLLSEHREAGGSVAASVAELARARERSVREVEAVLDEVVQLRLQVGLVALAGQSVPVRDRLRELLHRARALDEIARLDADEVA